MFVFIPVLILLYVLPPPQRVAQEAQDPNNKPRQAPGTYG